jgi:hypothetical protein
MEYLVSAENKIYDHWQLELLIESFKQNGCQNDLLLCLADYDSSINPDFWRNISEHQRIYAHQNIGQIRGYHPLNSLYSTLWANQYKLINQPFVSIPTDVVLREPLNVEFLNNGYPEVIFSPNPFFTFNLAKEHVGPFWKQSFRTQEYYKNSWVPIGPIVVFNNVPSTMFERTIFLAERLALQQLLDGKNIWEHTIQLAWSMNLADLLGKVTIKADYSLTMNMLSNNNAAFIHYEHGMPPIFNKLMFQYEPPNFFAMGDPMQILSDNFPTPSAYFISELAKISLNARKKKHE